MAPVRVEFYAEASGRSPVVSWLVELAGGDHAARERHVRCTRLLAALERQGNDLRRPVSAPLGGGLFELRVDGPDGVPIRLIYAFVGAGGALLLAGCLKASPSAFKRALGLARSRLAAYKTDPMRHTYLG